MQAAFNVGPGCFEVREVATPEPGPDEALIRVRASAICGSDKHEFRGERPPRRGDASDAAVGPLPPRIAGHEFSGTIAGFGGEETGGFREGDSVVVAPIIGCGRCPACAAGDFGECPQGRGAIGYSRPGGFATYVAVPVRNLLSMSPALSFAEASLVEPAAVGVHAATRVDLAGKRCLVVGAGAIGLLTAQAAQARGAGEVWAADTDPEHLAVADALGLRAALIGRDAPPAGELDVAFECVGRHDAPLATALEALRRQGTLVLVGSGHPGGLSTDALVFGSLTAIGSCGTSMGELRQAQEWMAAGCVRVQPLITAAFPLAQMNEAFAASLSAQKVMLDL